MPVKAAFFLLLAPWCAWGGTPSLADYHAMYDKCLTDAGPINNGTVTGCSDFVSQQAKAEMTALYKTIYDRLSAESPEDAAKLERAQKSWLVYRNQHCELAGSYVGSPMFAFCPMNLNISRVKELRELAGQ